MLMPRPIIGLPVVSVPLSSGPPAMPPADMPAATRAHYAPVAPERAAAHDGSDTEQIGVAPMGGKDEINGYDVYENEIVTPADPEPEEGVEEDD